MTSTEDILAERNHTHGEFSDNAMLSQGLKFVLRVSPGWNSLTDVQREALEMICLKLSRIGSGHANVADHWADISGYALLAVKEIENGEKAK